MELAEESLDDLRRVVDVSDRMFWNSLYYSVFYAAKAALLELGFKPKSHQGVDSLIGKVLYKDEDLITSEDSKFFSRMKTAREEIDYNPEANIDYEKESRRIHSTNERNKGKLNSQESPLRFKLESK